MRVQADDITFFFFTIVVFVVAAVEWKEKMLKKENIFRLKIQDLYNRKSNCG